MSVKHCFLILTFCYINVKATTETVFSSSADNTSASTSTNQQNVENRIAQQNISNRLGPALAVSIPLFIVIGALVALLVYNFVPESKKKQELPEKKLLFKVRQSITPQRRVENSVIGLGKTVSVTSVMHHSWRTAMDTKKVRSNIETINN